MRWPWTARERTDSGGGRNLPASHPGASAATEERAGPERRAAFERLAAEHGHSLYGAALRMARHPDDAEDLLQDALVQAYRAFDTFAEGTNFRAWLLRILTNLHINRYRRGRLVQFDSWDDLTLENEGGPAATHGDPADGPESALLRDALDEEITAALDRLSDPVRLTILLVDVEELTYEEAAAALAIPVGTVRSRLNRGREQLAGLLQDYARDRGMAGGRGEGGPGKRP